MIEYKGYTGIFEFDRELGLFAGHVIDLRDEIYFEGESVDEIEASMRRAVDHDLEVCEARAEAPGGHSPATKTVRPRKSKKARK